MTHEGRLAALAQGRHGALSSVAAGPCLSAYAEEIELLVRTVHVQGIQG